MDIWFQIFPYLFGNITYYEKTLLVSLAFKFRATEDYKIL